uniref:Uncharacterized protein n=1 Tax=Callorhinchus milii TaxID=7868 RepID=A0A4W3IEQ9_CALMI
RSYLTSDPCPGPLPPSSPHCLPLTVPYPRHSQNTHRCVQEGLKMEAANAERITYSRDFLMKIARLPISKEKPEFLPSLPVVLERPKIFSDEVHD